MRIPVLAGFALLALLSNAALADTSVEQRWFTDKPVGDGWFVRQANYVPPNLPKRWLPHWEGGIAATTGTAGKAVYFASARGGSILRAIPLADWRGKRVRLSLRLKGEGEARAGAGVEIFKADTNGITPPNQMNTGGNGAWESHQFVLDIPGDATTLFVAASLKGHGKLWVDGLRLEPVSTDVPASDTRLVINSAPRACSPPTPFPCF
jgi:hypothetical protein